MNKYLLSALLLLSMSGFFSNLLAQTITELSFSPPLPSTFDMVYIDDHLVISQQFMKIYDVSDPEDPDFEGQVLYPGSYAYQVAAEDNHVYMAKGNNGIFAMYNVSNFSMPYLTGSVSVPATSFLLAGDLVPFGNYVFMSGFDSLYVIDVSDSSAPHVIHTQEIPDVSFAGAGAMAISGDALFIITSVALQVYDISNPKVPVLVASFPNVKGGQKGIAVDTVAERILIPWVSSLATYAGYDAVDVSDPSSPEFLFSDSTIFGGGDYGETTYYQNVLFISKGGGVNAFDVSPFNHHYVTSFTGSNIANASVALDIRDSVFFNARGGGFEVLLYSGGFPTEAGELIKVPFSLQVFPNPISTTLQEIGFYLSEPVPDAQILIHNSMGAIAYHLSNVSFGKGQVKIPLQNTLLPGLYFITIRGIETSFTGKIMVN